MLSRSLYTALLYATSPLIFSLLLKTKKGKPPVGERWKEFVGITPELAQSQQPIWIHAVSVGEVIAATPIINALQQHYPEQPLLITTTTSTGAERVAALTGNIEHRYFPADYPCAIKQFISRMKPTLCLIMETELWPNMLTICNDENIPTIVVNARLSEKSQQKYQRFQSLFSSPLQKLTHILCQDENDLRRFKTLGLSQTQLSVTGTVKFDIQFSDTIINHGLSLREQFGKQRPVVIASSTHKGEDEIVLAAFEKVKQHHDALLILVPRHPERFDDVATRCLDKFPHTQRRSQTKATDNLNNIDVYLGDSMGEMPILLAASDICFMGGSLIGDKVGGHNLLEPAALSKACITGPSYYNFADVTAQLLVCDGVAVVNNELELANKINELMTQPEIAVVMGQQAKSVVEKNKGALTKIMQKLTFYIDQTLSQANTK
ncbi:lipid IV(A) 3-deoxy-D-manno-octulosonic acid transferase [Moritella viscosa]|uniref:3-deoxy-D-manno-octulosonic acid transferase n=1 Tax=Moritella viscosa TaxID=80854 RepID=A0A1L0AZI0_9GAMM|nr:lipid IV(A) 3-deoxy-D-manno-octulosonic acid transferase [Moritella viscosa]SGY94277.1 3-deoxy-D-manno-octulosonic-acid transferase [Moritella viscosa]SGZ05761.1 3-deoxy-D-manno-octulosonic-acid transferase [Moritella viscosa]SGZ05914.1 3-deoxy-D-manno-octulosonic-acid transferase [Moritella viscosa]SHO08883.1 3-deoxy-D-manno-octulosonic-acid transferase [Moritella viscosa]SHO08962.1 3-deoxy-D-manno-octulosonic-acid transferase [Moritella viscosa]